MSRVSIAALYRRLSELCLAPARRTGATACASAGLRTPPHKPCFESSSGNGGHRLVNTTAAPAAPSAVAAPAVSARRAVTSAKPPEHRGPAHLADIRRQFAVSLHRLASYPAPCSVAAAAAPKYRMFTLRSSCPYPPDTCWKVLMRCRSDASRPLQLAHSQGNLAAMRQLAAAHAVAGRPPEPWMCRRLVKVSCCDTLSENESLGGRSQDTTRTYAPQN